MNRYNIGRRIETYREKMGLSTQQLAVRINRSQATISRIENGKQGLTPELLTQIARELRVHPFALLSDEPLRQSILIPVPKDNTGEYVPTLLGIAIHSGRVKEKFRIAMAAHLLGVSKSELEMIELGLTQPEDGLLEKISHLFGMNLEELRLLNKMNSEFPELCRKLAYMQQMVAKISYVCQQTEPGKEISALSMISDMLGSSNYGFTISHGDTAASDEVSFANFSSRFGNLIRDKGFYEQFRNLLDSYQGGTEGEELSDSQRSDSEVIGEMAYKPAMTADESARMQASGNKIGRAHV